MSHETTLPTITTRRQIGPWGTTARIGIGAAFVTAAVILHPSAFDVLLGLVLVPTAMTLFVLLRGRRASPLRVGGAWAMVINTAVFFAFFLASSPAAALFYGISMLVAAIRGLAACEVMATSNVILHRDDQVGCPVFTPIDRAEGYLKSGDACR